MKSSYLIKVAIASNQEPFVKMSLRGMPDSYYGRRTDSSPSLHRSFSIKSTSSSGSGSTINPTISFTSSEASSSSASTPDGSTVLNVPYNETTRSTVPPRFQWNREAPAIYRPYDFQNFDVPFKTIPAYHSHLGGLDGVQPRDPCHHPKPDPFHKRTHIDEIYHKRVTDASTFSITEKLPTDLCVKQKPSKISEIALKAVKSVVLADNVNSDEDDSSESDLEEDLCELLWEECQAGPKRNDIVKECKRSFFRARKELFKSRQYEEYLEEKDRQPEEVGSCEISSDSTVETVDEDAVKTQSAIVPVPIDECRTTEIVHVENKARVQEHEQSYMERVRKHMWGQYEREEMEKEKAQAELNKSPEPLDEEEILKNLPKQDYLNKRQHQFRQELAERLEELNQSIKLKPNNYPKTKVQFEEYNDRLMRARRELRDEAILVDEHYKRAGREINVPEKDLPLKKKYRAVDYKSEEDEESGGDEEEALESVVHTCMTRLEWSRWLGRYTKQEKLNLPKVKIPRLPKVIHAASEQSPIRMYIKGLHREDKQKQREQKQNKPSPEASVVTVKKSKSKSIPWHLNEILYEKSEEFQLPYFVRYKAPIRPFSELVKDKSKLMQSKDRRKRDLRKNHMTWINEVVEEICSRKYL